MDFSFINIVFYFLIYAFLGWIIEVSYVYLLGEGLQNRGFLFSPILPIYGFGAIFLILMFYGEVGNVFLLFVMGFVVTTTLEYSTAVILENIFNIRWWDYSHHKFNFQGRVSLTNSLLFAIGTVILITGIHPFILEITSDISFDKRQVFVTVALIALTIDLYYVLKKLNHLPVRNIKLLNINSINREKIIKELKLEELNEKFINVKSDDLIRFYFLGSILLGLVIGLLTNFFLGIFTIFPLFIFFYSISQKVINKKKKDEENR